MGVSSEPNLSWLCSQKCKVEDINETNATIDKAELSATLIAARSLIVFLEKSLTRENFSLVSNVIDKKSENETLEEEPEAAFDSTDSPGKTFMDEDDSCDKSVIGSPLKLNRIADLTSLKPIRSFGQREKAPCPKGLDISSQMSVQNARNILQKFIAAKKNGLDESMLAILCNASDAKKTMMIGAQKKVVNDHMMLTTFLLTLKTINFSQLKEAQQLKSGQMYHMMADYELLDPSLGLGAITLTAKWSDAKGRLKITNPLSTDFSLKWSTITGNEQSPVYALNKELQKVSSFLDALLSSTLMEQTFLHREDSENSASVQLHDLFTRKKKSLQVEDWDQDASEQLKNMSLFDAGTKKLILSLPVERDFTDELWDVLIHCSDLQELVHCMKATFDEMRLGQIHVFLSMDNHSMLAKLSRAAASGLAVFPPLNAELALRLATEIGLEKLRKLYHHLMVTTNKLCSQAQWDELFYLDATAMASGTESEKELITLSAHLASLKKFHFCLESVAIVDVFTEHQDLSMIASVVLSSLRRNGHNNNNNNRILCNSEEKDSNNMTFSTLVSPAVALPEVEKHQWTSMRREIVASTLAVVETFVDHMPEGLIAKTPCESGSMLCFTAQQNHLQL